jgi:nitroreductase
MATEVRADYPVQELIPRRWSPYSFADRCVSPEDLQSLFEAARWAPSSYNEQPWRFIVARREDGEAHAKVLSCLVEANQAWARYVPVLALGVISKAFAHNNKPNRCAPHDLGLATANLMLEATARGLHVHAMAGIRPDTARAVFGIPDGYDAFTGLAIGYAGVCESLSEEVRSRDAERRGRKPIRTFVFGTTWEEPASFLNMK